jgi:hypothetical protein
VTLGVWVVPIVLVAMVLMLWASVWFEGRFAPIGDNSDLRTLESVDTASPITFPLAPHDPGKGGRTSPD